MERKKIYVGSNTIIRGTYDECDYSATYSVDAIQTAITKTLEACKEEWWEGGSSIEVFGRDVEWRILPSSYELILVGFVDEPEDEWKARVGKEQEKKRKEEEKERKKLKELMKKYPDMLESK
jgi:TRAP-type mannitol/chloroaromatic compound transport system substrate-binding protein